MRVAPEIVLTSEEQAELVRLSQSTSDNPRLAQRARIVLLAALGIQNKDVAQELGVGRVQVARWRERYVQSRLAGIEHDLPRGAPAPRVDVQRLVHLAAQPISDRAPHRSTRALAAAMGISPASVSRHLRARQSKPQAAASVDLGQEWLRRDGIEGISGLYLSRTLRALVLCRPAVPPDEEPEAVSQAEEHAMPPLDTAALLSRIDALDGQLFSEASEASAHMPWLKFLRRIARETPDGLRPLVVTHDHAVHHHPSVQKWLARHARFECKSAPAIAPWLAGIGQLLSSIEPRLLRMPGFTGATLLVTAIDAQTSLAGPHAAPFAWTGAPRTWRRSVTDARANQQPVGHSALQGPPVARLKTKASPKSRLSGQGDTLRDNVINLKRGRILQEAAKLFFENGYLQTSVEAIAERLGATKPFVYYHFQSKAAILVEICEKSNRDVLTAAESAMSVVGSPRARFEKFIREFTHVALQQHQLVAIYFREEISLPPGAAERIKQMRKSINTRLTSLLSEGIKSGDFQIEDPRIGALVIAGMASYAFAWYRESGRLDQEEVTHRIVKMALKLVSASPFPRSAYRIHSVTRT